MPPDAVWPRLSVAPDPRLAPVQRALALLTRQPVLLAVTLSHTVADEQYDIAGHVQAGFWWGVDRLAGDAQGQPRRDGSWGRGQRACETAETAYLAAVGWVERPEHRG